MAPSSQLPAGLESSDALLSVLEITKQPLISVPQCYVRTNQQQQPVPFDHDHKATIIIPSIDMIKLVNGEATDSSDEELQKLHSICKEWGLFQLVNHGVSPTLLEKLKYETEEFFKLPLEQKMKYKIRSGEVEGYGNIVKDKHQKLDWGDRFFIITNPILRRKPHLFPELPSSLRTTLESYLLELEKLSMALVGILGKALKIEKREIEELFDDGMRAVRMTYYPPCPQPELVMGITPHSDATGITILNQLNGVDGLQIHKDGVWIPVNFIQDAFVVNVGDIFEMLSNGVYKSIEHRVMVNSETERMSIAMFFNPKFEAEIGPMPSLISPQNPPLFKSIGMEKYVQDFFTRRKIDGKSYLDQMKIQNANTNTTSTA